MLADQMDASTLKIPPGFQTKLDASLVLIQLQMIQDLAKSSDSPSAKKKCFDSTPAASSVSSGNTTNTRPLETSSDKRDGKRNGDGSAAGMGSQTVSRTSSSHSDGDVTPKRKYGKGKNEEASKTVSPLSPANSSVPGQSSSVTRVSNSGSDSKQCADKRTAPPPQQVSEEERRRRLNDLKQLLPGASNFGDPASKLRAAEPYGLFLTTVKASVPTHAEPLSMTFSELLHPSLGDLESSLQINFMVDLGWLMANYYVHGHSKKPLLILHGEDTDDLRDPKKLPMHIKAVRIKTPHPFGHHHTKMTLLRYSDGSLRVVVSTANLIESDWENRTQGLWVSPACPELPRGCDTGAGDSPTEFKADLLRYLAAYRLPQLQEWVGRARRADFSAVRVCFVSSVPGTHRGAELERWGHRRLGALLRRHVAGAADGRWDVVAQCSSVGSLGPEPESWACGELRASMAQRAGASLALQSAPQFRVIYPSFRNVASSCDGLLGGSCLPYSMKTHQKQTWFTRFLHEWKSAGRHRSEAMPHIKTYARVSPCGGELAWFVLSSANLSKAAWGSLSKAKGKVSADPGLYVMSYEAGVLFLPKFLVNDSVFHLGEERSTTVPPFPMPYDLPLLPYGPRDKPWVVEYLSE
ncbi:probable tyrosyl-DNA phosphodiesterase isoform X2 [Bacillus rossius redtenbacheri]